ncbi:MAG: hypothetical protein JWO82_1199, partial [Akkermansiaceae bacterium]|nr:hypothetical protein [Akkermansiaceae bacterium]
MKAPKPKLFHLLSLSLILGSPLSGAGLPDAQVRYDDVKEMKSANPNFTDWLPVK